LIPLKFANCYPPRVDCPQDFRPCSCSTIDSVAELIINDELKPPPACPHCAATFAQGSLHIFTNTAECRSCNRVSRLSELVEATPTTRVLDVPPRGVIFSEQAVGWTLMASPRSKRAALETWLFSMIWGGGLVFMGSIPGGGFSIRYLLLAFTPLWVAKAIFQTWGHYTISVRGSTGVVVTGIGRLGWRRTFNWEGLRTVRLTRQKVGRGGVRNTIVLNSDQTVGFGEELSDEQRTFVALLLVKQSERSNRAA